MEIFREDPIEQGGLKRYEDSIITPSLRERVRWWVYEHTEFTRPMVRVGDSYGRPRFIGRRHELYHQQQAEERLTAILKEHRSS